MQPRKYQGYAQSKGFNPIDAPDTAGQLARQGEQTLRGMERAQRQLSSNQQGLVSGLDRAASLGDQNRNIIFNYDQTQRRRIYEDEMRHRRVSWSEIWSSCLLCQPQLAKLQRHL